jgi:hypothetical protein
LFREIGKGNLDREQTFWIDALASDAKPAPATRNRAVELGPPAKGGDVLGQSAVRINVEGRKLGRDEQSVERGVDDGDCSLPGEELAVHKLAFVKPKVRAITRLAAGDDRALEKPSAEAVDACGPVRLSWLDPHLVGSAQKDAVECDPRVAHVRSSWRSPSSARMISFS